MSERERFEDRLKDWLRDEPAEQAEALALLRRVAEEAQQPIRAEEQYWRHDVVTTRLCPVDHTKPHVSHDCVAKIESELSAAREQVRRLRMELINLLSGLPDFPFPETPSGARIRGDSVRLAVRDIRAARAALAETAQEEEK